MAGSVGADGATVGVGCVATGGGTVVVGGGVVGDGTVTDGGTVTAGAVVVTGGTVVTGKVTVEEGRMVVGSAEVPGAAVDVVRVVLVGVVTVVEAEGVLGCVSGELPALQAQRDRLSDRISKYRMIGFISELLSARRLYKTNNTHSFSERQVAFSRKTKPTCGCAIKAAAFGKMFCYFAMRKKNLQICGCVL